MNKQRADLATYAGILVTLAGLVLAGLHIDLAPATPELGAWAGVIITVITLAAHALTSKQPPTP